MESSLTSRNRLPSRTDGILPGPFVSSATAADIMASFRMDSREMLCVLGGVAAGAVATYAFSYTWGARSANGDSKVWTQGFKQEVSRPALR